MLKRLAKIEDAIEGCWNDLQPHISVCAECGDEGQDNSALIQVATLMVVAGNYVGYVLWTLTPKDGGAKEAQAEDQTAQETTTVKTLGTICEEVSDCWLQLYNYRTEFAEQLESVDDANVYKLERAENLLEVA
jgi:hypothetical protein